MKLKIIISFLTILTVVFVTSYLTVFNSSESGKQATSTAPLKIDITTISEACTPEEIWAARDEGNDLVAVNTYAEKIKTVFRNGDLKQLLSMMNTEARKKFYRTEYMWAKPQNLQKRDAKNI